MPLPFTRTEKGVYIFIGYFAPLAGSVLAIVFMAMHGSKFGPHSVPVRVENANHNVLMDGPPESLLLAFWLLTCLQVCMIIMNLVGPCSCENRMHFPCQMVGLGSDAAYLVLANHSIQFWPKGAQVHDPLVYFNVSAVLMLIGQSVLAWGAFRLSGSGCRAPSGSLTAEELALRNRRRQMFLPVFYRDEPAERTRVRCDYVEAEDGDMELDILDEEADEILALYPNTVTAQMLESGEYGLESAALATGGRGWGGEDWGDDIDDDHTRLMRDPQGQQLPLEAVYKSRRF